MSSQLTNLLVSIKAALVAAAPGVTISDTYQEFAVWGDQALAPGIFTILPGGAPGADVNLYYQDFTIVGQGIIAPATLQNNANGTPGSQITEAEGKMLDQLRFLARSAPDQVEIMGHRQSMQLASPYYWIAMDIRVGPFSFDDAPPAALQPLAQIQFTIDATAPDGSDPTAAGTAKPAQT